MKQLYIVKSGTTYGGGATPKNLLNMTKGSIGIYLLNNVSSWASAKATTDFAIVWGRGANSPAIVFPEVNPNTMDVTLAEPVAGVAYEGVVTIPTPTANNNYTLVLSKLGAKFNERSNYTVTEFIPINGSMTAAQLATSLAKQLKAKADMGNLDISVELDGAEITVTGLNTGEGFVLQGADGLSGISVTETAAKVATGDKAYVERLASMCAAGKGFNDTYADGPSNIPGYPEEVEDTTYNIITLRFNVGRKSAKTRDEVVNQLVHIAVPVASTSLLTTLKTVLGLPT